MSLMSRNAPTLVKVEDWVLPSSTTSGVFAASGSAVVSLVTRSPQSCCSMTSFDPGFSASKVVVRYSRSSSGVSPPASHRVIVAGSGVPPSPVEPVEPSPLPHAARASAAATPTAAVRRIFTLVFLPGARRSPSGVAEGGASDLQVVGSGSSRDPELTGQDEDGGSEERGVLSQ